jgi:hypothetical protein
MKWCRSEGIVAVCVGEYIRGLGEGFPKMGEPERSTLS